MKKSFCTLGIVVALTAGCQEATADSAPEVSPTTAATGHPLARVRRSRISVLLIRTPRTSPW